MMSISKKGQLGGPLAVAVSMVFGLFFIGILLFAFALAGANMSASTTDNTAKAVIGNTTAGAQQLATFSPVLWIMVGIGVLITILIVSVGAFFLSRR
jgi:uncharacterized protein (UPF0333 family)